MERSRVITATIKRHPGARWLGSGTVLLAVLTGLALVFARPGDAAPDATLAIGSVVAAPNQEVTVPISANITASALGALTFDISYVSAAASASGCQGAAGFLCNAAFSSTAARCGGFHAYGRAGAFSVCTISILYAGQQGQCFPLTGNVVELVEPDGTALDHQVQDGTICTDMDSDGAVDASDNCVLVANAEQLNTDGDGAGNACDLDDDNDSLTQIRTETGGSCVTTGAEPAFRDCVELFVGTDSLDRCADTTKANDEAVDKVPGDFNDDRKMNSTDVNLLKNAIKGAYNNRFDLNASGKVDSTDLAILSAFVKATGGKACSP